MSKNRVNKTFQEINEKIRQGKAVVVTAEEMIDVVERNGDEGAARKVDVVTTGTFSPMCSSGAFLNFGHTAPKIRASKVWLNDVPAYGGIAAVDCYLGATEVVEEDPLDDQAISPSEDPPDQGPDRGGLAVRPGQDRRLERAPAGPSPGVPALSPGLVRDDDAGQGQEDPADRQDGVGKDGVHQVALPFRFSSFLTRVRSSRALNGFTT